MGCGINLGPNPSSDEILTAFKKVRPGEEGKENPFTHNIKRIQKIIEFRELRSGKDFANMLQRSAKLKLWGQRSHEHLVNFSNHNCFLTVYDYDIKIWFIAIYLAFCIFILG